VLWKCRFSRTAGFQPAVALCFQPTHLESEITFGFLRCSSAIANGVSKDAHTTAVRMDGGTVKEKYRWFPTGGCVVLPANVFRVRNNIRVSALFVRYRERCEQDAHTTAAKMDGGTLRERYRLFPTGGRVVLPPNAISSPKYILGFHSVRPLSRTV
jgi:hypothetical protein